MEAPAVQMGMSSVRQSMRMAGTTSWRTYWWNWFCIHIRCSGVPSLLNHPPATLSHE
jgi:hypothetical protein